MGNDPFGCAMENRSPIWTASSSKPSVVKFSQSYPKAVFFAAFALPSRHRARADSNRL